MDTAQNKAVVEEFDQLGNRGGDLARLDALCMPDMVNHALAPGRPPGLGGRGSFFGRLSVMCTVPGGRSTSSSPRTTWWCSSARASMTGPVAGSAGSMFLRALTSGTRPSPTGWLPGASPNAGRFATTSRCSCSSVGFARRNRPYSPVLTLGGSRPNPTAADPRDGRVLSRPSSRVHEPCILAGSGCPAVTVGLDRFRESQILLRRAGGGHSHFHPHTSGQKPNPFPGTEPCRARLIGGHLHLIGLSEAVSGGRLP